MQVEDSQILEWLCFFKKIINKSILLVYILQNDKYIGLKPYTEDEKIKSTLFPELEFNVADIFA